MGAVQPRHGQMLFHQRVHHGAADPLVTLGEKQGVPILAADGVAHRQIAGQRVLAGIVEVHHTHLVALAQHPHGVILNITKIQADQFGNTQVKDFSYQLAIYIYDKGLASAKFSMATAVGIFQSLVGLVLVLLSDRIAKMLGEEGLL